MPDRSVVMYVQDLYRLFIDGLLPRNYVFPNPADACANHRIVAALARESLRSHTTNEPNQGFRLKPEWYALHLIRCYEVALGNKLIATGSRNKLPDDLLQELNINGLHMMPDVEFSMGDERSLVILHVTIGQWVREQCNILYTFNFEMGIERYALTLHLGIIDTMIMIYRERKYHDAQSNMFIRTAGALIEYIEKNLNQFMLV